MAQAKQACPNHLRRNASAMCWVPGLSGLFILDPRSFRLRLECPFRAQRGPVPCISHGAFKLEHILCHGVADRQVKGWADWFGKQSIPGS